MTAQETAKIAAALQARDWPAAERLLRKRTARASATAEDHYNLGAVQNEMGRWRYAITALKRAARMAPRNPVVWLQLGRAALAAPDLPLAAEAFGKAWRLQPGDRAARLNYGKLSLRLGDWTTAREALAGFDEPEIRALAYRAAAEMGDPAARAELDAMLTDPAARAQAVYAMAKTAKARIPLRPPPMKR